MNHMSANIERIADARLSELGTTANVKFYRHYKIDKKKFALNMNEHDCISCRKHITGKIPNLKMCKATCGTPLYTELRKRVLIVKNSNELTKQEIREILAMSRLIKQTEQQTT